MDSCREMHWGIVMWVASWFGGARSFLWWGNSPAGGIVYTQIPKSKCSQTNPQMDFLREMQLGICCDCFLRLELVWSWGLDPPRCGLKWLDGLQLARPYPHAHRSATSKCIGRNRIRVKSIAKPNRKIMSFSGFQKSREGGV
jgi:hypothetical protein